MKNFWHNSNLINNYLKKYEQLLIFFDFDGTLAPISPTWELTKLPEKTRSLIKKLIKNPNIYPVIISGRPLDDVKRKTGIPGIDLSGNHGLEWEIDGKYHNSTDLNHIKPTFSKIKELLNKLKNKYNGVLIEDKKITIAVHFRLLKEKYNEEFLSKVKNFLNKYQGKEINYTLGKKVIDIKPNTDWNKGGFCKYYINELKEKLQKQFGVIYIGDDTTDEDAFKVLKNEITIRVGHAVNSSAGYYLNDQTEVNKFIQFINSTFYN